MTKDLNVSTSQSSFTHKKLIVISVASTGCSISEEFLESSLARPFWFTFALLVLHSLLTGAQIAHAIIVFWLHIDCCICSSGVVSYWSLYEKGGTVISNLSGHENEIKPPLFQEVKLSTALDMSNQEQTDQNGFLVNHFLTLPSLLMEV